MHIQVVFSASRRAASLRSVGSLPSSNSGEYIKPAKYSAMWKNYDINYVEYDDGPPDLELLGYVTV